MKLIQYIIIISAIISYQWPLYAFELSNVYSEELKPLLDITKDESGVTVRYDFPGAFILEDDLYSGTYSLSIPGFGVNMIPGSGAWLNHWDTFEIPANCVVNIQILDTETSFFPIKLAPSRPPLIDSSNDVYSIENVPEIEPYSGWMPKECVEKSDIKIYRDRNILYVGIFPVSYNVEESLLKAYDHITYKVNFQYDNCTFANSANVAERHEIDSNYFGNVFTSALTSEDSNEETTVDLLNPLVKSSDIDQNDPLQLPSYVTSWNKSPGYLILTCSKYASAVSNFATWKKKIVSGDVQWSQRSVYVIPEEDLDKYKYYIIADNITPTPLDDYFSRLQNSEAKIMEHVANDGNVVTVYYKLPQNCLDATISVRGITTHSMKTVSCPNDENMVPVNMQGMPNGLYVIELCTNGITVDTRKIMIK